jgi:hypothetical protein
LQRSSTFILMLWSYATVALSSSSCWEVALQRSSTIGRKRGS